MHYIRKYIYSLLITALHYALHCALSGYFKVVQVIQSLDIYYLLTHFISDVEIIYYCLLDSPINLNEKVSQLSRGSTIKSEK